MRKLPTILAALFILLTLVRVADFSRSAMQAGWLGWLFSAGLGAAVYGSAYWTRVSAMRGDEEDRRSRQTRRMAWFALLLFVAADGFFNLSEVRRTVTDPGLYNAATIYGLFPTLAAALLGALQGFVDRLPHPPQKYNVAVALRVWLIRMIDPPAEISQAASAANPNLAEVPQRPAALPQPPAEISQSARRYECSAAGCEFSTNSQRSYAAHMRVHRKVEVEA